MKTIQLTINGTNLSSFVKYPISFTRKNLDESLNLLEITLFSTTNSVPYKPNTIADIVILDGATEWFSGQMLVNGDTVTRVGVTNKYHHRMSFIELTYLLSLEVLPDMAITRISVVPEGQIGSVYEPTLADVVDKILKYSEGTFSKTLSLGQATRNILAAIQAPELTMTRYTTLEALRLVFGMAKIVPVCQVAGFLNHINVTNTTSSTISNTYAAQSEAFDANQFRTRLYSPVENFIGGGDLQGSIVEPKDGWLTARSPDGNEINNDKALFVTSRPIYKIEEFNLYPTVFYYRYYDIGSTRYIKGMVVRLDTVSSFVNGQGFNAVEQIYEKATYELLPNTESGRGSAFSYTQNQPNIVNVTTKPDTLSDFWDPAKQAFKTFMFKALKSVESGNYTGPEITNYSGLKTNLDARWLTLYELTDFTGYGNEVIGFVPEGTFNFGEFIDTKFEMIRLGGAGVEPNLFPLFYDETTFNIFGAINMRVQIKYTPYISTNIMTFKERKETGDPTHITTSFYNQSANTVSDEVLAELHDKVIKRGNAPTQTIRKIVTNLSDIPGLGVVVGDYVLTAQDITITADNASVEYVLSKDFAKLNQYVAVLEKYRQFAIPAEQVVDRQLTINEFAKFSRTTATKTAAISVSGYMGTQEITIMTSDTDASYKLPGDNTTYPVGTSLLPTTNFAFNNALVFEASYKTNALVGSQSGDFISGGTTSNTRRQERPLPYVDNTGYFNEITTLRLGNDLSGAFSLADSNLLPNLIDSLQTTFATFTNIDVEKDARERLRISYMLHHIDETQKIFINRGWAKRCGLIGGPGYTGLRFAYFNQKPIELRTNVSNYSPVGTNPNVNITSDINKVTITHTGSVPNANYWGVIDENGDLLFWVNEPCVAGIAPAPLYINFSNTY